MREQTGRLALPLCLCLSISSSFFLVASFRNSCVLTMALAM